MSNDTTETKAREHKKFSELAYPFVCFNEIDWTRMPWHRPFGATARGKEGMTENKTGNRVTTPLVARLEMARPYVRGTAVVDSDGITIYVSTEDTPMTGKSAKGNTSTPYYFLPRGDLGKNKMLKLLREIGAEEPVHVSLLTQKHGFKPMNGAIGAAKKQKSAKEKTIEVKSEVPEPEAA